MCMWPSDMSVWMQCGNVWLLLYPKHLQHASRRAWPPGSYAVSCELKSHWCSVLCTANPSVLSHQELLGRWAATAVENYPPPLALQSLVLLSMPHHQPCNVHQLLQMLESFLLAPTSSKEPSTADNLVHGCTNQKRIQWSFHDVLALPY